jgi:hypothetical protein
MWSKHRHFICGFWTIKTKKKNLLLIKITNTDIFCVIFLYGLSNLWLSVPIGDKVQAATEEVSPPRPCPFL